MKSFHSPRYMQTTATHQNIRFYVFAYRLLLLRVRLRVREDTAVLPSPWDIVHLARQAWNILCHSKQRVALPCGDKRQSHKRDALQSPQSGHNNQDRPIRSTHELHSQPRNSPLRIGRRMLYCDPCGFGLVSFADTALDVLYLDLLTAMPYRLGF